MRFTKKGTNGEWGYASRHNGNFKSNKFNFSIKRIFTNKIKKLIYNGY